MGAFNRVLIAETCHRCDTRIERAYQFKFGNKWQYDYRLGDRLRWGGNDQGTPGLPMVLVPGVPEKCRLCGYDEDAEYRIRVEGDVLRSVDGPFRYTRFVYSSHSGVAQTYETLMRASDDLGGTWSQRHPGSLVRRFRQRPGSTSQSIQSTFGGPTTTLLS